MPGKLYRPPFEVTPRALAASIEIMRLVGRYEGWLSPKAQPKLRRHNQIRTVHASLAIEGNTLSFDQVTAILDDKRVIGPQKDVLEVANAIAVYAGAAAIDPGSIRQLLGAHRRLMAGLVPDAGRFRMKNVGVFHGARVRHVAPPAKQVPGLVAQLLSFLKTDRATHPLVKSAVAHYELELIHPFSDGNGRIGRLWQHVLLLHFHPVFECLPFESVIHSRQKDYYRTLAHCDQAGSSTAFIEFSLDTIRESLESFLRDLRPPPATPRSRIELARAVFGKRTFSRRDYLTHFKTISTATASRDLRDGVAQKLLKMTGTKSLARYRYRGSSF